MEDEEISAERFVGGRGSAHHTDWVNYSKPNEATYERLKKLQIVDDSFKEKSEKITTDSFW